MKQDRGGVMWFLAVAIICQGLGVVYLGRLVGRDAIQVGVVAVVLGILVAQAWRHRLLLNHRIDMLLVMGAFGGLGMLAGWWVDLGFQPPPPEAGFHAAMGHGCSSSPQPLDGGATGCCAPTEGQDAVETSSDIHSKAPHAEPPAIPDTGNNDRPASEAAHGGGGSWTMVTSWMTALMLLAAIPPGLAWTRCADLARSGWRRWVSTHIVGNVAMVVGMVWIGHAVGPLLAHTLGSNVLGGHLAMLGGMLAGMEIGMLAGEAVLGLKPWQEWRW
jgi:hypothetical protein